MKNIPLSSQLRLAAASVKDSKRFIEKYASPPAEKSAEELAIAIAKGKIEAKQVPVDKREEVYKTLASMTTDSSKYPNLRRSKHIVPAMKVLKLKVGSGGLEPYDDFLRKENIKAVKRLIDKLEDMIPNDENAIKVLKPALFNLGGWTSDPDIFYGKLQRSYDDVVMFANRSPTYTKIKQIALAMSKLLAVGLNNQVDARAAESFVQDARYFLEESKRFAHPSDKMSNLSEQDRSALKNVVKRTESMIPWPQMDLARLIKTSLGQINAALAHPDLYMRLLDDVGDTLRNNISYYPDGSRPKKVAEATWWLCKATIAYGRESGHMQAHLSNAKQLLDEAEGLED